jgi:hypothetical protein
MGKEVGRRDIILIWKLAEGNAEISKLLVDNKYYPVRDVNLRLTEYQTGGLTHQPRCSFGGAHKHFILVSRLVTQCGEAQRSLGRSRIGEFLTVGER